jgi:hypothetical protein
MARSDGVAVSHKIRSPSERTRLETLGKWLKPEGYRILLRTESRGAKGKEIQQDIHHIQTALEGILKKAEEAVKRNTGPLLLYKAMTPTQAIVRDLMSAEVGLEPLGSGVEVGLEMGFGNWDLGFGFGVWRWGFGAWGLGFGVRMGDWDLGLRIHIWVWFAVLLWSGVRGRFLAEKSWLKRAWLCK